LAGLFGFRLGFLKFLLSLFLLGDIAGKAEYLVAIIVIFGMDVIPNPPYISELRMGTVIELTGLPVSLHDLAIELPKLLLVFRMDGMVGKGIHGGDLLGARVEKA
jgi:hypothetical protein